MPSKSTTRHARALSSSLQKQRLVGTPVSPSTTQVTFEQHASQQRQQQQQQQKSSAKQASRQKPLHNWLEQPSGSEPWHPYRSDGVPVGHKTSVPSSPTESQVAVPPPMNHFNISDTIIVECKSFGSKTKLRNR